MKGKKTCPNCNSIIPARADSCSCGFNFYENKNEPENKEHVQEAVKGRKQCPQCSKFNGVRTAKCECGHDFTMLPAKAPKFVPKKFYVNTSAEDIIPEPQKQEGEKYSFLTGTIEGRKIGSRVLVPSGVCPSLIKDFSDEGIMSWAKSVFNEYYNTKQGACLTKEAIFYFARQSIKNDDLKNQKVNEVLNSNVCASFFV